MTDTLNDSVEAAFQALLLAALPSGSNVYTGKRSGNRKLPYVVCACDGEATEEDPPRTGNFWVSAEIQVYATAATEPGALTDPRADEISLAKSVFDLVRVNNLDALLNAQGQDLTVFPQGLFFNSPKSGEDAQGAFMDVLPIRLYCCASVLAP